MLEAVKCNISNNTKFQTFELVAFYNYSFHLLSSHFLMEASSSFLSTILVPFVMQCNTLRKATLTWCRHRNGAVLLPYQLESFCCCALFL